MFIFPEKRARLCIGDKAPREGKSVKAGLLTENVGIGTATDHQVMGLSCSHVLEREQRPIPGRSAFPHLRDRLACLHQS